MRPVCERCAFRDDSGLPFCRPHRPAGLGEQPGIRFRTGRYGKAKFPPDGAELELVPSEQLRWALETLDGRGNYRQALLRECQLVLSLRAGKGHEEASR